MLSRVHFTTTTKKGELCGNRGLEVIIMEPHWFIDFNKRAPQCSGEGDYGGTAYFLLSRFSYELKMALKE